MIPSVMGWKSVGIAIVACSGLACAGQPVEPRVSVAFERAVDRYPQPLRVKLEKIGLAREPDYGVPEDAPLMMRLLGDAAYAFFSSMHDQVVILDAGLAERAVWTGGGASRDEVAGLMADLASALEAPADDVKAQWEAFVEAVQGWEGEPRIAGEIRLGDERVLDRFVRLGVRRALAREWEQSGALDLDAQMIHELAHAAQLSGQGMAASAHLHAWGTLSGWVRADRNEPFDGFHGGMMMMEQPAVLGRLLLSGERGEGLYAHAPGARFVNLYAAYDAREDYAESVRLFFEQPERLIRIDPVKFMFINALGYNTALSIDDPGPLWIDAAEMQERGWCKDLQRGASELITGRAGSRADARTVAALLRAHARVLSAENLPECEVFSEIPSDAPDSIARGFDPARFSVEIDGDRFGPDARAVQGLLSSAIIAWYEDDVFWRGMHELGEPDAESLEREFADIEDMEDPQARAMAAARLLSQAKRAVGLKRATEMMAREVRAMRAADQQMLAETLKLRYTIMMDRSVSPVLIDSWAESVTHESGSYGAVELGRGLVDLLLLLGKTDRAIEAAKSISGGSWGLLRKVEALCAIAADTSRASALDTAAAAIADLPENELSEYLERMITGTRESIMSHEENEE